MTSYLVTGGAGFIGSNLVTTLVEQGHQVRVLDNFSTGHEANLADVRREIDARRGDVRDLAAVRDAVQGVEYVLHQAAVASVPRSVQDPVTSNEANVSGTLNVLVAAREAGVRRVVYASSSSVYGETEVLPKVETMQAAPISPYAVTKYAGELYCVVFSRTLGQEAVALRYFNVFGPRQDPNSHYAAVIPKFATAMLAGHPPVIFGDGSQSRDFCFIDNVVSANLLACTAPDAPGGVFNVACGERITLSGLVEELNGILGTSIQPRFDDWRPGDIRHSLADITAARDTLGYEVAVPLREGLRRTLSWYAQR